MRSTTAHRPTTARDGGNPAASAWVGTRPRPVVRQLQPGRDNKQINLGASGSVVVHPGSDLRPAGGETFGLVEVPEVGGVGLDGYSSVRTDGRGYAVLPTCNPYRYNWVNLDTNTLEAIPRSATARKWPCRPGAPWLPSCSSAESGRRVQFDLSMDSEERFPSVHRHTTRKSGSWNGRQPVPFAGVRYRGPGAPVHSLERWPCSVDYQLPPRNKDLTYERVAPQLPSVLDLKCPRCSRVKAKGEDFSGEHRARGQAAAHSSSIMLNRSGVLPRVSKRSNHCLAANPPAKPVRPPEAPITLWQGATMDSGFRPLAAPTARTALGLPICTAISV